MFKSFCHLLVLACLQPLSLQAFEALRVSVSIPPQQYLLERIGEDLVDVQVMLKPGDSAESFDPTLKQISALNNTQIYFRIGIPFEDKWIGSLQKNNTSIKIVACCQDIVESRSISLDSHIWTSPRNLQLLAAVVKDILVSFAPEHHQIFEENYSGLMRDLKKLDKEIQLALKQRRTDYFIINHAALGHFAKDYGLTQLSLEREGKELGARGLVRMIRQARQEKIQTLFVHKQHPSTTATAFANEINADLIEIDPLHSDYLKNLRNISQLIARATR
mgnify:FL=1